MVVYREIAPSVALSDRVECFWWLEGPAEARPTYAAIAAELGAPVTTVTNDLALARRMFRGLVLGALRQLTGSDEEYRAEARRLVGADSV